MERNTVERAIKTETLTRTESKGVGKLRWLTLKTWKLIQTGNKHGTAMGAVLNNKLCECYFSRQVIGRQQVKHA